MRRPVFWREMSHGVAAFSWRAGWKLAAGPVAGKCQLEASRVIAADGAETTKLRERGLPG